MIKPYLNFIKRQRGYTLVELLVAIIILISLGSIIANITTSLLRSSNKTNNIENIRRNGNYALSQMSKTIGYAKSFGGFSHDSSPNAYITSCPIPSAKRMYEYVKVVPFNSSEVVYNCVSPSTFTVNGTSVVDTNSVSMTQCQISCTQANASDVPIIGISFTLVPRSQTGLAETSNSIKFETSIVMRNYVK